MAEQVADSHLAGHVGVGHLEAGQAVHNAIVPIEFAFINEHGECSGCEDLGVRRDAE